MPKLDDLTWGAALLALALSACHYDPTVPEGRIKCQANSDCPAAFQCLPRPSADDRHCCQTQPCGFPEGQADGSAPADAAVDRPADRAPPRAPDATVDLPDDVAVPSDGPAADGAAADRAPDLTVPPDLSPDTAPACPPAQGGPAMVRAGTFCIDATEVTNQQYAAFLAAKGSDTAGQPPACKWNNSFVPSTDGVIWPYLNGRGNYPVGNVDWCDAFAFCQWSGKRLCGKLGGGRLATVDAASGVTGQWFSACTSGGRLTFPYGMMLQRDSCNIGAPSDAAMYVEEVQHRPACEGGYPGLFDMAGNMEEWVDGCDKDTGSGDDCAIAGSDSWTGNLKPEDLTCHGSVFGAPRNTRFYLLGFRCCAD